MQSLSQQTTSKLQIEFVVLKFRYINSAWRHVIKFRYGKHPARTCAPFVVIKFFNKIREIRCVRFNNCRKLAISQSSISRSTYVNKADRDILDSRNFSLRLGSFSRDWKSCHK